ncbi:MAG: hypothetical protein WCC90_17615 [Methylocella sp.]
MFDLARGICAEAAASLPPKVAKQTTKAAVVAAVERLAKADRAHAATADQWDADQSFFNCKRKIRDVN